MRRRELERVFSDQRYGTSALHTVLHPGEIRDIMSRYIALPYQVLGIMHLYTFYVIRGDVIASFMREAHESFFTERLQGDRYLFERDFYQIAFKQGYEPYTEDVVQLRFNGWDAVVSDRNAFDARVREWKERSVVPMTAEELWRAGERYKIQQKKKEFLALIDLVRESGARTIIDIGCYTGGTTICFAHCAQRLVSCDIRRRFELDEMKQLCAYDFVEGDSHSAATYETVKRLLCGTPADFLFIDGDHTEQGAYGDYLVYRTLVRPGGWIAFHDIVDSESHRRQNCYVSRAWEKVKKKHNCVREFVYDDLTWGGIGAVQKE
jgi:predicted O-methyltransferase YrrM